MPRKLWDEFEITAGRPFLTGDDDERPDWIEVEPVWRATTWDLVGLLAVAFAAGAAATVILVKLLGSQ